MCEDRLRHIYNNMMRRCYNSANKDYRFYGAKGIKVCREWRNSRESFYRWAYKTGYNDIATIDRIDPKQNYCPRNCRWVDAKTNAKIKTTTRLITIDGVVDSLSGWASHTGIPKNSLVHWARGRNDDEVINYIKRRNKRKGNEKISILCNYDDTGRNLVLRH